MVINKPKLLYAVDVHRSKYFRRFMWILLAVVASGVAWIILDEITNRNIVDGNILEIGKGVAAAVVILLAARGLIKLWHFFTTRNESVRLFDRGLMWQRGKKQYKYGWNSLKSFRDAARARYLFGRPIYHTGAHIFMMRDAKTFKFNWKHGNPAQFAREITPYLADTIGGAGTAATSNSARTS